LCREHGQQLTDAFAAHNNNTVSMWGVLKEVGVDDEGLADFYHNHFTFPLYLDLEHETFQAFGSRTIGLTTWNPLRLYRGFKAMGKRLADKNITGNYKGEGTIQGGILLFDKQGQLRYAYDEEIGTELPMEDIQAAVDAILVQTGKEENVGDNIKVKEEL